MLSNRYNILKRELKLLLSFVYDFSLYKKSSIVKKHKDVQGEQAIGLIIRLYHTIEKGLSIKDRRLEFSLGNVTLLQYKLLTFNGDKSSVYIKSAISTLEYYYSAHEGEDYSDEFIRQREIFNQLKSTYKVVSLGGGIKKPIDVSQIEKNAAIELVKSRSSIRDYDRTREVAVNEIIDVIDIAKSCPSACNRQAIKLYYSLDREVNKKILELQNGSKTFRDNVPGLFIITSDLRYQEGVEERNLGYIEGGIWIMSIVNSLHFKGLSSCVLNWCVVPEVDRKLKDLVNIPDYSQISALISFGYASKDQHVPFSIRKESSEFLSKISLDD